jgi:hypothetical protein
MKCLRCGYCCCFLDVAIIKLSAIQKDGSVDFDNENNYEYKPCNVQCPHLQWAGDKAVCSVYHYPWFVDTPCHAYKQIESKDSPCRTGDYFKENKEDIRERLEKLK